MSCSPFDVSISAQVCLLVLLTSSDETHHPLDLGGALPQSYSTCISCIHCNQYLHLIYSRSIQIHPMSFLTLIQIFPERALGSNGSSFREPQMHLRTGAFLKRVQRRKRTRLLHPASYMHEQLQPQPCYHTKKNASVFGLMSSSHQNFL